VSRALSGGAAAALLEVRDCAFATVDAASRKAMVRARMV
jgi:hypothetical protein